MRHRKKFTRQYENHVAKLGSKKDETRYSVVFTVHKDVCNTRDCMNLLDEHVFEIFPSYKHTDVPEPNKVGKTLCRDAQFKFHFYFYKKF